MKKTICLIVIMLGVLFCLTTKQPYLKHDLSAVHAQSVTTTKGRDLDKEDIFFRYKDKIFEYNLDNNIKSTNQFDLNYKINKYHRFGTRAQRQELLKQMLSIGVDKQIAIEYLFPNLLKVVNKVGKNIYIQPQDAQLTIDSNANPVFKIKQEVQGLYLDTETLYSNICKSYLQNSQLIFNLPVIKTNPNIYANEFKQYTNLRADFSTDISNSNEDRKHNIKNALSSINRVELLPGEVFSFNKIVGRRTEQNGYRTAKIIVNNQFVEGIGGGVCQVSSTLYNAALLAGLEIVEANKHSKQVGYVKYGFDAMVNFGSSDLKFANNTPNKIIIITNYSSTKARIRIFGQDMGNKEYKLKNEIVKIEEPQEEIISDLTGEYKDKVIYDDEWFYLQTASKGMEIKSYREEYVDGQMVKSNLLRWDKYKVQNAIKMFGAKKREQNIVANSLPLC